VAPGPYTAGELGRAEAALGLDAEAREHLSFALRELPEQDASARAVVRQALERVQTRADAAASTLAPVAARVDERRVDEPGIRIVTSPAPRESPWRPAAGPVLGAGAAFGLSAIGVGAIFTLAAVDGEANPAALRRAAAAHYVVGALVLGGAVTYAIWFRPKAATPGVGAAPVVSSSGGGLVVGGSL
jgi:hypothetical protein